MIFVIEFVLALAVFASAANINVIVGADDSSVFEPPSVRAQKGDVLQFEFFSSNLSVSQSTFESPCTIAPGGVDSGLLVPLDPNTHPIWSFTIVDDSVPLFFFCAQIAPEHHCQTGMVFVINDNPQQSFNAFQVI
ncbi:hypothetical protein AGABI2DRAFT_63506 [Agaricus bisporus var. bisporus H97]|uniref:hypothetical protein n=1 Tax=Agaricus bisporus var. bisporus (strain H97 / ATCC MYA-4626 / FGSC 10389) TaxID=936046 RepID=UPI00029F6F9D|nr:hypothetical protein AGABI2DRAFT_63506 [Agaricus bisporus var. bisporus H97]EKV49814.1 hypothetical protein AGABI2DRAFT_63506 [Agaricus bisporus var. bisporus H97]